MSRLRHLVLLSTVVAASAVASYAGAASSSTVVAIDVPSAIQITNGCTGDPATRFGVVLPGSNATTDTGAGRCTVSWSSSNDSSMLRIAQRDGTGTAMSSPTAFTGSTNYSLFNSVATVDGTNALAVGNGGTFSSSADGGATWTHSYNLGGQSAEVLEVAQVPGTPSKSWLTGYNGRLQVVTDSFTAPAATDRWPQLQASGWPSSIAVDAVAPVDIDTVFVGGDDGWVAKSDDDGATWTSFQLAATGGVTALSIAPTGHVWMTTTGNSSGNIWRAPTTGGTSAADWTQFAVATSGALYAISVPGASNGYAVGMSGAIYSWDGTTWTSRGDVTLTDASLNAVESPSGVAGSAVAVGSDGVIVRSTDGGSTWSRVASPVGSELRDVSAGTGAIVGVGMARATMRSTTAGASWVFQSDVAAARSRRTMAIEPVDGKVVLAVGSRGTIWRSGDGGATWTLPTSGTTEALFSVAFASRMVAWAVGSGGTVLRSDDAGLTWSPRTSGTTVRLMGVAGSSDDHMLAVGDGGTVLRTTTGGSGFTSRIVGGGRPLHGVTAPTPTRAVLVGWETILRSDDGGSTWTAPTSTPAATSLRAVSMHDADHGIAAALWSGAWYTSDGGVTWSWSAIANMHGRGALMVTPKMGYLSGRTLNRTRDGGATWEEVAVGQSWPISVAASDENHVVVGREHGGSYVSHSSTVAGVAIPDYGASPNSWATSTEGMFGVCVQAIGAQTAASAPWTADGGTCTAVDTDPWRAIPTSPSTVATVATAGNSGSVDLVFGLRVADGQPPGAYSAGIVFEALAPSA